MRNEKFQRYAFLLAVTLYVLLFHTPLTPAQTVISRSRIGGYTEDIAYVSSGALKDSRVKLGLVQGNDITAITTGPLTGAFAVVDRSGGEVVIFRLD